MLVPGQREGGDGGSGCTSSPTYLHCRAQPFTDRDRLCPVSTKRAKRDIHYLDDGQRREVARSVLDLKLASYVYKDDPEAQPTLGFLVEDAPEAPFVIQRRSRVDEHAYVSALVATVQEQERAIAALGARVEALEARCNAPPRGKSTGPR